VRDLNFQTFVIRGRDGGDASGKGNQGRAGRSKRVMVPQGTVVKEITRTYLLEAGAPADAGGADGDGDDAARAPQIKFNKAGMPYKESAVALVDLDTHGQRICVASGGAPGVGNRGSMLTYSQQVNAATSPHIRGAHGEARFLELELKSIADVGLVGFPNAGKSSFLGAVSKVRRRATSVHPSKCGAHG
jgi:GTP-binding protein